MSKLGLIIKREYMTAVMKKSFIVTTLLVPILSVLVCGVLPVVMSQVKSDEKKTVAIVDQTDGQLFVNNFTESDEYIFQPVTSIATGDEGIRDIYSHTDGLYAIVVLPANFVQTQKFNIYSDNAVTLSLENDIKYVLYEPMRKQKLAVYSDMENLESILKDCEVNMSSRTIKWNEKGEESISSAGVASIIGMVLAMLTYMFVLLYGALIMNSVIEEKTNRIVEVIVSCCKPFDLMMGKIIGVALVGITQIAIWCGLLSLISFVFGVSTMFVGNGLSTEMMATMNEAEIQAAMAQVQQDGFLGDIISMVSSLNFTEIFVCFLLYFVGGYLLYASLFAAFSSAVDQASDASQFTAPIMIVMVFALYAAIFSIENPDGPLAWWCSMIPFTSPIVMMIRLPYDVPAWELALSIGLLFATALGIVWFAGRIYRTGILMYGRKFTVKDIIRWIK